jgi:hypothetical protein
MLEREAQYIPVAVEFQPYRVIEGGMPGNSLLFFLSIRSVADKSPSCKENIA